MIGCGIGLARPRRRTSAWSPLSLPGLLASYSADRVTLSDATHASVLLDSAGLAPANAGASLTNQGVMVTVAGANGQAGVSLDGNDKYTTAGAVGSGVDGAWTSAYWVGSFGTLTTAECAFALSSVGGVRWSQSVSGAVFLAADGLTVRRGEVWNAAIAFCVGTLVASTATLCIATTSRNGSYAGQRLWVNGVAVPLSPADATTLAPTGALVIGSTSAGTFCRGVFHHLTVTGEQATVGTVANFASFSHLKYGTPI